MESVTSNLSAQIYRHGNYKLRHTRPALYVNATHVPSLRLAPIRVPEHYLVVSGQIAVKYAGENSWLYFDDSTRYFDPDFRLRRI